MNINIHNVISVKHSRFDFPATETSSPFSRVSLVVRDDEGVVCELKLFSESPIIIIEEDGE